MKSSFKKEPRGFTLIELLVVISIIAVLSSVILVALNSARQKGTIGSAMEFDDHNYHKLGVGTIAAYNFSEGSGSVTKDSSGNGYNLTLAGAAAFDSSNTYSGSGYSLKIPTANDYAGTASLPNISLVGSGAQGFTVSIWSKRSTTGVGYLLSLGNSGSVIFYIQCIGGGFPNRLVVAPTYVFIPPSTITSPICTDTTNWHNLTVTVSTGGTNSVLIEYVDGQMSTTTTLAGIATTANVTSLSVGNWYAGGSPNTLGFLGNISNVKIYNELLTASNIKNIYAVGALEHGITLR